MRCDEIRELAEAYALDALEAGERAGVESHLASCPDCRRLVRDYEETASLLPQALAAASPLRLPSALRARVLQSAQALPPPAAPSPAGGRRPGRASIPVSPCRRLSWWRPQTIGVLAAAALLALSLAWSVQLGVALARERALRTEFASLVGQQEIVLEVVDSSQTVRRVLRAVESGSPAYGKLYTRPDLPHVVAMAARLPQPPAGQAYHLWLTSQGAVRLAGVMAVNSQGFGLLVFDADRNGPAYEAAQLALQPEGSAAPAGAVALRWEAPR